VDGRVQANIEKLGIRVLRRCTLAGWRQVGSHVEALHLMTPLHALRLPCFAFFYYGLKAIDINAFKGYIVIRFSFDQQYNTAVLMKKAVRVIFPFPQLKTT
jgi:hypothetical protein